MFPMLTFFADEMVSAQLVKGGIGSYVEGEWVPDTGVTLDVSIVFPQPINQKELQMFSDGEHTRNIVKTWISGNAETREKLKDADRIIYNGVYYKIMQVEDRSFSGNYLKVFMAEIQ